jgi:hypothetical protein
MRCEFITGGLSSFVLLFVGGGLLSGPTPARAATSIDTFPLWNGVNNIFNFGEDNTSVYGQTFKAPLTDPVMTSFTFRMNDQLDPDIVDFDAVVMAWNGTRATGPVLFTAGPFSSTGQSGFETFAINTGNLALTPGASYVAFFSQANRFDGSIGHSVWAYLGTSFTAGANAYVDGNFVFLNCASDSSQYTTTNWENPTFYGGQATHDLAFSMTFVPEPTAAMTAGCVALASMRAHRKTRRQVPA